MNIAIITNGVITNVTVFNEIQAAQSFLAAGVWPGADDVRELPDGYGIGDLFDAETNTWSIIPERQTVAETHVEPNPQFSTDDYLIDLDYRVSLLELGGDIT